MSGNQDIPDYPPVTTLLLYPPFGAIEGPYISIPVLAAYLMSRGLPVEALDMNLGLFHHILSPARRESSYCFAAERFESLNERQELSFEDMVEYFRLVMALHRGGPPFHDINLNRQKGIVEQVEEIRSALRLASTPFFPESVEFIEVYRILTYLTRFQKFSSSDILESIQSPNVITQLLRDVLTPLLQERSPGIVGISATFPDQVHGAFMCAHIVKQVLPRAHVTMGGAFVSCHMRNITEPRLFSCVDSFILDDGEIPLECLIREISSPSPDLSKVPGIKYLSNDRIVSVPPAAPLPLQSLPTPAYDIFPLDDYLVERSNMLIPFRLSRGCYWARCSFCRTELSFIHRHDQPDAAFLLRQIEELIDQTGSRNLIFTDDSSDPLVLESLSNLIIEKGLQVTWTTNFRFDPKLTIERCLLYRQAGCIAVNAGLEAYNDRILRLMKKGTTTKLADRILSNMAWAGLPVSVYMIVGFPTETEDEAIASFNAVHDLSVKGLISRYRYHTLNIVPFSDMHRNPSAYGITGFEISSKQDLAPPIYNFSCSGMSRGTALQLESRFNHTIVKEKAQLRTNPFVGEINLNGRIVPLAYEMKKIFDIIQEHLKTSGEEQSFFLWLQKGKDHFSLSRNGTLNRLLKND